MLASGQDWTKQLVLSQSSSFLVEVGQTQSFFTILSIGQIKYRDNSKQANSPVLSG